MPVAATAEQPVAATAEQAAAPRLTPLLLRECQ